jgi:hypothetical protein
VGRVTAIVLGRTVQPYALGKEFTALFDTATCDFCMHDITAVVTTSQKRRSSSLTPIDGRVLET